MTTAPEDFETRDGRRVLCHVDDIGEAGKGFSLTGFYAHRPDKEVPIFLIPDGGEVRGYKNICPHQGIPLELKPDTFLDVNRELIQCTTHGAQFRKEDGYCLRGPCVGRSLAKVAVVIDDDGMVLLDE